MIYSRKITDAVTVGDLHANAYIGPPGSGAPWHTDPYHVALLGLTGHKIVSLPDGDHDLGPGDVVVIPAGCPHSTRTDEGSTHLTFRITSQDLGIGLD